MPKSTRGFTLIELLVAISIVAILSVIGLVSFQGIRGKALEAQRRADIDSIKKAYEANYDPTLNGGQGGYKPLEDKNFSSGKIPTPPEGGSYLSVVGPGSLDGTTLPPGQNSSSNLAYKVCATLVNNINNCVSSTQGDSSIITKINSLTNPTCDPNGNLALGLVAYWKFDGNFQDSAGSNHGSSVGEGIDRNAGGKFGNALNLNGSTQYVGVDNATALQVGTQPFSVSFWVSIGNGGSSYHIIMGKKNGSWNDTGWFFREAGGNVIVFHLANGSANDESVQYSLAAPLKSWYHVVGVRDGTTLSLYIDGDKKLTTTNSIYSSDLNNNTNLNFGYLAGWGYFKGLIDDARLYKKALSDQEISSLYNKGDGCVP